MKISEVKVGAEYGAHDSPSSRYHRDDPRQVKVLEIVTVEEKIYGGAWSSSASQRTRKVRRVKVEVLDGETNSRKSWVREKIGNASRGDVLTIEARHLVAPWRDLRGDILARKKKEQERIELEENIEGRIKSAGFKLGYGETRVRVNDKHRIEISFSDAEAKKLLSKLGI